MGYPCAPRSGGELPYCFDMRFRTARPIAADKLEEVFKAATFKQPLRFYRPEGKTRTMAGWPFDRAAMPTLEKQKPAASGFKRGY